jgi:hypothetical protein
LYPILKKIEEYIDYIHQLFTKFEN